MAKLSRRDSTTICSNFLFFEGCVVCRRGDICPFCSNPCTRRPRPSSGRQGLSCEIDHLIYTFLSPIIYSTASLLDRLSHLFSSTTYKPLASVMFFARYLLIASIVGGVLAETRFAIPMRSVMFNSGLTILLPTAAFPPNARIPSLPSLLPRVLSVSTPPASSKFSCKDPTVPSSVPSIPG